MRNGPAGATYSCSKSGWTNVEIHLQWLQYFQSQVKSTENDPVLLILDNHSSHISFDAYNFYRKHSIVVVTLPPHTSDRTQPLDVSFFRPLKCALSMEYKLYLGLHPFERITEYNIAELLNKAWLKTATPAKAVSGFLTCGIYPLNHEKFDANEFACHIASDLQPESNINDNSMEHSKEKDNTQAVKVADIIPLPLPQIKTESKREKLHSEIFSASSQKIKLEEASRRRQNKDNEKDIKAKSKKQTKKVQTAEKKPITKKSTKTIATTSKRGRPKKAKHE